ncbi:MAG TPA: hypothetical protein VHR41_01195, partial [Gemmatimonadales bacterium]|nr:hypothetical protein [Gemmatimonadales bacterium]
TCRPMAVRTPAAVAEARLKRPRAKRKKEGRKLSQAQRLLCRWTVMVTDLAAERFTAEALWVLYRVRRQVELLFNADFRWCLALAAAP